MGRANTISKSRYDLKKIKAVSERGDILSFPLLNQKMCCFSHQKTQSHDIKKEKRDGINDTRRVPLITEVHSKFHTFLLVHTSSPDPVFGG